MNRERKRVTENRSCLVKADLMLLQVLVSFSFIPFKGQAHKAMLSLVEYTLRVCSCQPNQAHLVSNRGFEHSLIGRYPRPVAIYRESRSKYNSGIPNPVLALPCGTDSDYHREQARFMPFPQDKNHFYQEVKCRLSAKQFVSRSLVFCLDRNTLGGVD